MEQMTYEELAMLHRMVSDIKALHVVTDPEAVTALREFAYVENEVGTPVYAKRLMNAVRFVRISEMPEGALDTVLKWKRVVKAAKGA